MFKKSVLQLLCWSSLGVLAQSNQFPGFKAGADQVLKGISQYPVSSGILYSRVVPFSGMSQPATGTPRIWTAFKFAQAVHELEEAALEPVKSPLGKKLKQEYQKICRKGDLQMLAFCTPVHVIDTGRINDSSLIIGNKTITFNPRLEGQSPFREQMVSAACLMDFQTLTAGKAYRILYPRSIKPGPAAREITSVRVRTGTRPWESILPGQPLIRTFSEPGSTILEIEISWSGGLLEVYRNQLLVSSEDACLNPDLFSRPDDCPCWLSESEFAPNWPATGITANIPFEGLTGKGEVFHYLRENNPSGSQNTSYRDPIIFVDGIDFGDTRKGEVIYGKYLSYMPEPGAPNSVRLGAQLRNQGHDLIILNFPDGRIASNVEQGKANPEIDGGCDYIERNAMVLVNLIQKVNAALEPGSKKITIVGPSMGGLIARFALAYMEKHQLNTGNHQCGLFISQDAPHLGSNIPVGIQQLIENLDGFNVAEAELVWENLNSPAAQELLINHAKPGENVPHSNLRTSFLSNCQFNGLPGSLGWPKDPELRLAALSNGNLNGFSVNPTGELGSGITGSGNMLNFDLQMKAKEFLAVAMAVFGGGFILPPLALLYSGTMEWKSYYAPGHNNNARTFSFNFGFSLFEEGIEVYSDSRNWQALDGGNTLDGSAGGFSNSTEILASAVDEGLGNADGLINLNINHADKFHSFIPVKSALAFRWNAEGLRNVQENLNERNLVCTGETPFHAYYCNGTNEEHVRLNMGSVQFLFNQLNYSAPPDGVQYEAQIEGPKAVPAGSKTSFTALYQGNLEFRTSWSIPQVNGVTASIINPFSQTCYVQVSSGSGQENGFYYITATTEVKTLDGDWVCAGRKSQKVQVRKIVFMGSINTTCDGDLAEGCGYFIFSGTPNYSNLSNGVTHSGYQWEISRYSNTDFSTSCWNGALTITPYGTTNQGEQKALITLGNGFGIGNIFTYYARVRNLMQIPNPDFGNPGEPQVLVIEGVWKMIQLQTEKLPGPGCIPCPVAAILEPENPISGTDLEVVLSLNQPLHTASYSLTDEYGTVIRQSDFSGLNVGIPLKNLLPGPYTIQINSQQGNQELEFWLKPESETMLMTSPMVLRKNMDKLIRFRILDDHFTETGTGNYQARIFEISSGSGFNWTGQLQEFCKMVNEFSPGDYRIELNNGVKTIQSNFIVLSEEEVQLTLFPNPAENQMRISLPGYQPELRPARIIIKSVFGHVKMEREMNEDSILLDISELNPDLYLLEFIRDGRIWHRWFSKN